MVVVAVLVVALPVVAKPMVAAPAAVVLVSAPPAQVALLGTDRVEVNKDQAAPAPPVVHSAETDSAEFETESHSMVVRCWLWNPKRSPVVRAETSEADRTETAETLAVGHMGKAA